MLQVECPQSCDARHSLSRLHCLLCQLFVHCSAAVQVYNQVQASESLRLRVLAQLHCHGNALWINQAQVSRAAVVGRAAYHMSIDSVY